MSSSDSRFTDIWDAVDPFDTRYPHLWIKIEHLGRYLFAAHYLEQEKAYNVVDAGCGTGYGAVELARLCERVTAFDSDESVLVTAKQQHRAENIHYLHVGLGDGHLERALGSGTQDGVVCFETLEHVIDPAAVLLEFFSVLRPGGNVIISVPNGEFERYDETGLLTNRMHRRAFSISSVRELLETAGFSIDNVLGQPLTNTISANETRLIRRRLTDGRVGDEQALHKSATIRRMSLAIGYPEQRDVERSYSFILIAHRPAK